MPLGKGASPVKDAMMGILGKGNVGGAQAGTPNAPMAPDAGGGISIPASQLGPVSVGDTVTLTVTAVDGDNVSLEKADDASLPADSGASALPPTQ
jgi:hypothetical protein